MTPQITATFSANGIDKIIHPDGRVEIRETPLRRGSCEHKPADEGEDDYNGWKHSTCRRCDRAIRSTWTPPTDATPKWHWSIWR